MRLFPVWCCLLLLGGIVPVSAQETPAAGGVRIEFGDNPSLTLGPLKLDFKARIESSVRTPTRDIGIDHTQLTWGSRRAGLEGKLGKRVSFQVERDFRPRTTPWRDVYVDLRVTRALEIQSGRFKIPFGRDTLTATSNRDFIYRSLAAAQLTPSRDTGIMAHGRLWGRALEYQAGYFVRDGDRSRTATTEGGRDALAVRLVATPLAWTGLGSLAPLEVGVALANSHLDSRLGLRGRTALGDGTFFDRVFVNGRRRRAGLEAAWAGGPTSITAEYIVVTDERKGMGFDRADLTPVRARAWYAAGTWALTGEQKHGRIEPRRAITAGGVGALELAVRVERIRFDTVAYPGTEFGFPSASALQSNRDRVTTLGLNWYLNHYLKLQANLITESIDDRQRSPAPGGRGRFTSGIMRFQFLL